MKLCKTAIMSVLLVSSCLLLYPSMGFLHESASRAYSLVCRFNVALFCVSVIGTAFAFYFKSNALLFVAVVFDGLLFAHFVVMPHWAN